MQEQTKEQKDNNEGPPAKNLRKNSGRNLTGELNMAQVGDKGKFGRKNESEREKEKRKRSKLNEAKIDNSTLTPSVKAWLQSNDSEQENGFQGFQDDKDETRSVEINQHKESWEQYYRNKKYQTLRQLSTNENQDKRNDYEPVNNEQMRKSGNHESSTEVCDDEQDYTELPESESDEDEDWKTTDDEENNEEEEENEVRNQIDEEIQERPMHEIMEDIFRTINDMKKTYSKNEKKGERIVNNMKSKIRLQNQVINKLTGKVKSCEDKLKVLTNVTIHQDQRIKGLKSRADKAEKRSMQNNLLLSGLPEMKGEKCKELVKNFITKTLNIKDEIPIVNAHRIGKGENRIIVFKLQSQQHKGIIYKSSKVLKDIKDENGRQKYYLNDQLPDELAEEQRRGRQIIKFNKSLIDSQQQSIEWKKGQLFVDGNKYNPKVQAITDEEILRIAMKTDEVKKILSINLVESKRQSKDGSHFLAMAKQVYSIQEVIDAYKQVKYRFADGTHLMCAYRILDEDVAHHQDAIDDGEFGAGRRLLQMMIDKSFNNRAVFVIRHHQGKNIGPVRFQIINQVAEEALNKVPDGLEQLLQKDGLIGRQNFTLHSKADTTSNTSVMSIMNKGRGAHNNRTPRKRTGSVAAKVHHFNEQSSPLTATERKEH